MVLVDTSVWIEFFRRSGTDTARTISGLLEARRVVICGPVIAELIQGIRTEKERSAVLGDLDALPYVEPDRDDWIAVGWIQNELLKKGITVPLTDALIARLCIRYDFSIYSFDKHFRHFSRLKKFQRI
jgi:predicted nucleic acid-binding protein